MPLRKSAAADYLIFGTKSAERENRTKTMGVFQIFKGDSQTAKRKSLGFRRSRNIGL